ncbi:MAG: hypothetical protein E7627_00615 [Ruminococcaceae bacterium]|nr:hypothetical protein [Oscillospiraceae bacterium]
MNLYYLLIIPIIIGFFLQEFFKKQFQNKKKEHTSLFSTLLYGLVLICACFIVQAIIWGINGFEQLIYPGTFVYSLGFAICYVGGTVFSILAISSGPFAITSLVMSYSLMLPTLWSLIFYTNDNSPSVFVILGIVFMCISLFLVRNKNADDNMKITPRWIIFVIINFVSNGGCNIFQTIFNEENKKNNIVIEPYKFLLVSMSLVLVAFIIIVSVYVIVNRKKNLEKPNIKQLIGYGCATGISNTIANTLVLLVAGITIPAYILFPLDTVGQLTLIFLVSVMFFKEKYTRLQYVGYFIGMASVVLLNIG